MSTVPSLAISSSPLGLPIPESPYAVSVSLPTWQDNVGYEEGDVRVHGQLQAGYPRFVFHPLCRRLFELCQQRWGGAGESCLVFPTRGSVSRFGEWMRRRANVEIRLQPLAYGDIHAAFFPATQATEAKAFWQHAGEGISPRLAEAAGNVLRDRSAGSGDVQSNSETENGEPSKAAIRARLAGQLGCAADDVFLFPCGMNAAFQWHRLLAAQWPERRSVQFGFPYVDTLKIQQKLGAGVLFLPRGDERDLVTLQSAAAGERFAAIYTEFPSNPLLNTPDLEALAEIARKSEIPLVVDDTVSSCCNVDLSEVADVVWMSLTKYFSGVGDVTGGAMVVNPRSRLAEPLRSLLQAGYEDLLLPADAAALEQNSVDFARRVKTVNSNAERLADHLQLHPRVEQIYYPKFRQPDLYRKFLKPGGGYGGLLSVTLKDAASRAPRFFDALDVAKGPNLGMAYTLACPYTVLAHYTEFDFAESCGVSRWLVRISVGVEPIEELIQKFDAALEA